MGNNGKLEDEADDLELLSRSTSVETRLQPVAGGFITVIKPRARTRWQSKIRSVRS